MTNTSVARMKHSGIRDGSLPGFHFISSGLLVLTARWSRGSPGPRPPRRLPLAAGPALPGGKRGAASGAWCNSKKNVGRMSEA